MIGRSQVSFERLQRSEVKASNAGVGSERGEVMGRATRGAVCVSPVCDE